jgi:hypothetical protein
MSLCLYYLCDGHAVRLPPGPSSRGPVHTSGNHLGPAAAIIRLPLTHQNLLLGPMHMQKPHMQKPRMHRGYRGYRERVAEAGVQGSRGRSEEIGIPRFGLRLPPIRPPFYRLRALLPLYFFQGREIPHQAPVLQTAHLIDLIQAIQRIQRLPGAHIRTHIRTYARTYAHKHIRT